MTRVLTRLLSSLLAFALGWYAGSQSPAPPPTENTTEIETEARDLLDQGAKDISAAATDAEKNQKTQELLEKIFKLFLVNLTFKVAQPTCPPAAEPQCPTPATPTPTAATTREIPTHHASPPPPETPSTFQAQNEARRRGIEVRVIEASDRRSLRGALNELAKLDVQGPYRDSKALTTDQTQNLLGRWRGRVRLNTGRFWGVRMNIEETSTASTSPSYRYTIILRKGDNNNSETSGQGSLKSFTAGGSTLFVDCNDVLLELLPTDGGRGLAGVAFQFANKLDLKPIGTVELNRL